jgi:hypothetical protein
LSELQVALLLIAGALLLVIYVAGKWQERRLLRRLGEQFGGEVGDALLASEAPGAARAPAARARIEPGLQTVGGAQSDPTGTLVEAAHIAPRAATEAVPAPSIPKRSDWVEDPMLDCVLELRCTRQVDGVSFIDAAMPLTGGQWPLPVAFVVWDARAEQWVHPDRFGYYTDALAAIQLADRRRVLDEEQVGRFVAAVRHLAVVLDADCDPPDVARVAAGAAELDRLCARFDVRIAVNLEALGDPWTQARVDAAASQASLLPAGPLKWAPPSSAGASPLSLSMPAAVSERASLELDVPRTPAGAGTVQALFSLGNQLAAQLNARLVDDNGRPIDADSVTAIEAQLDKLFADMKAAGIDAGGERARRLYS